mgnify:CR=1 FL=1
MDRIPEPELMLGREQAEAYSAADFSESNDRFVTLLREHLSNLPERGHALDLGCGPGDILFRFAKMFSSWKVDGIDASPVMLSIGRRRATALHLDSRIELFEERLPVQELPRISYDLFFSNSLLHHLPDPAILWSTIDQFSNAETSIFVMDLVRPESRDEAEELVERYAGNESTVLRTDFFNSLLAAYRLEEIEEQLQGSSRFSFAVEMVSDRHVMIWRSA